MADDITPEQIELREKYLDMIRDGIRLTEEQKDQLKELLDLGGRMVMGMRSRNHSAFDWKVACLCAMDLCNCSIHIWEHSFVVRFDSIHLYCRAKYH